jgi:putative NIF3 family GTP cyclohydrolase 1 type 2
LEKLFVVRLDRFIDKYELLSNSQYGFRTNRSTSLALMELTEEITTAIDNKEATIGVYIDLKKAFDTIDHQLLLKKMEQYGIRGKTNDWISSYLNNRSQYVKYNDCESDLLKVVCGVPQGSILGPKLFIMYINDICNVSNKLKFILFADDTNIFYSHVNLDNLVSIVNDELKKLYDWFAVNKLSLNLLKTNYMLFKKSNTEPNVDLCMKNCKIKRVFVTKFLGVMIDEDLNWKNHINHVKTKLSKSIAILCKAGKVLNENVMRILYCSLVLPYLLYCIEVWGNTYKTYLNTLILLQKKAIRIVSGADYLDHTNCLFLRNNLLKFNDIIELNILLVMFKAHNNSLPRNLQKCFSVKEEKYSSRFKNKFKVNFVRTDIKARNISVYGVKLWNALDYKLTCCTDMGMLKKLFKNYCFEKYSLLEKERV